MIQFQNGTDAGQQRGIVVPYGFRGDIVMNSRPQSLEHFLSVLGTTAVDLRESHAILKSALTGTQQGKDAATDLVMGRLLRSARTLEAVRTNALDHLVLNVATPPNVRRDDVSVPGVTELLNDPQRRPRLLRHVPSSRAPAPPALRSTPASESVYPTEGPNGSEEDS